MVNIQADMLVPGWKESMFAMERSNVSCTRSSARSMLPDSEIAKARRLGTAASIASRNEGGASCRGPLVFVVFVIVELLQHLDETIGHAGVHDIVVHRA